MRKRVSFATVLFSLAILLCAGWILLLPVSASRQWGALRAQHLRSSSFPVWAVQKLVPSMYNFAQRGGQPANLKWYNHYPLRAITFDPVVRSDLFSRNSPRIFYFESGYRGEKIRSTYRVQVQSGKLYMKLVEGEKDAH